MNEAPSPLFNFDAYVRAPLPHLSEDAQANDALKADIAAHGQQQPIIADAAGLIWVGWRRYCACRALGITPVLQVVADGQAAVVSDLLRREHSAIDRARIMKWMAERLSADAKFAAQRGRLTERLSRHLVQNLGLTSHTSPRHIASALRLADTTDAEAVQLRALKADGTVHRAEQALRRIRRQAAEPEHHTSASPTDLCERILKDADRLAAEIRALPSVHGHPLMCERLRSLCAEVLAKLDQEPAPGEDHPLQAHAEFTPWSHQEAMCAEAMDALDKDLRTIAFVGPTGSGKTALGFLMAANILSASDRLLGKPRDQVRIIWLSLTREQEAQARRFHAEFGLVPVENIIFLSAFHRGVSPCDLLIMDEDHRTAMPTLVRKYERITPTIAIGLTATHFRLDLGALAFERVIKAPSVDTLISAGVLAPFEHFVIPEFTSATVADRYIAEPERWGPTLAFFDTIAEADDFVARLQRAGHGAETVTATSPRAAQISAFQSGTIAVLAAVGVLSEGFDAKSLTTVFARDGSRGPVTQICGRALRRSGNKVANIVQSRHSRYPYTRDATPRARFLWSPDGWVRLTDNHALTELPARMADRKSSLRITLPPFLDQRQRRRRPFDNTQTQEAS